MWCGDRLVREASAGMSVALSLEGDHDVVRGDIIVAGGGEAELAHLFKVRLVWMDDQPLFPVDAICSKGWPGRQLPVSPASEEHRTGHVPEAGSRPLLAQ
jgi:hypothetical protein